MSDLIPSPSAAPASGRPGGPARRRVAIVGAGSAYMPSVIRGLIAHADSIAGSQVVLYDIDAERLELVARLARRMFEAAGVSYEVSTATTLEGAIDSSDFVFTTFRPGGLEARYLDETIPLRCGVLGQETVGPGGFMMACRSVPVLLRIAELVESRAPGAWIVNYTNPTNIVTDAVMRFAGYERIIGLCDQYESDERTWARIVGLDPQGIEVDWYGTNHCTWGRTVRSHGVDVTTQVAERFGELDPAAFDDPFERYLAQLGRDFGYFVNHYVPYYYFHDEFVTELRAAPTTRAQDIMAQLPALYAGFAAEAEKPNPNPTARGGAGWGEFAVDVISAVACDEGKRFVVNTRNNGAIPELEDTAIVEVPVIIDASGLRAQKMGALPHPGRGLTQAVHEYEVLAAEAAALGSTTRALRALMAHPMVRSRAGAVQILDEGMAAHHRFLPQFTHASAG